MGMTMESAEIAREWTEQRAFDERERFDIALDNEIELIQRTPVEIIEALKEIDDIDGYERARVQRDYAVTEFERRQGQELQGRYEYDAICVLARKNLLQQ